MFKGRSFTTTILLSLSFILIITIIKDADGSTEACYHGTTAECQVFNKADQEMLMDTQEHRQILETTYSDSLASNGGNGKFISYKSLDPGQQACSSGNCPAKGVVDPGRRCKNNNYSCR
ncbi:hypothetical protein HanRHA438_Chr09g0412351 [Helianthus annuus]|uniref:Rapid ALkalinization Factor n=1 Tax=Helianthus annuus TaxID=4232 RepID=A0A9K3N9Z4_HELAN|nr:hypothetical protein HanXRQr2_Chr09g0400541 [Helianthus annuus]KAJ0535518.1 hypothetical protein HanIR_Chr09g0431491 [Helianthus annuus]KAJ0712325.1 hypothetical protein HanOQP8_Chr09g0333611 [Helianthus annuus]KAJ0889390.1 hypothetical protein HanRHA438_Chr09g0412351 [Helianthus annuus]KAJ0894194.1 hypothetical protein HanPSC8_Chr09g0386311 [Helianthus annuus]